MVRLLSSLTTLPHIDQQYESLRVALSLAHNGGFADPYLLPTGPTAHVAPGFPLVISLIYRVFGEGMAGETAKRILGCMVGSLPYALLPAVSVACGFGSLPGWIGGLWGAVIPLNRHEEIAGNWESPWSAVGVLVLVYLTAKRAGAWRFGLAGGITLLFAPAVAPVLAAFAVVRRWWWALPIAALLVLPWAWRNHHALGAWIWGRSNFGLELSLSNRDQTTSNIRDNLRLGYHKASHPSHSLREADLVCYWGEAEYNHRRLETAREWIATHPARFASLTLARIRQFWFPSVYFTLLVALAAIGLWRAPNAWIFGTLWTVFPLVYYLVQYDPRYRHPMEWSVLLLAAKGVTDLRRLFLPHGSTL